MAAQVCARPAPVPHQPASTTSSQLSINTSQAGSPKAVPHKHIPYCSPGPRPASHQLDTPPASPPSSSQLVETTSLLYPPSGFDKITNEPPIYSISAEKLSQAIDHLATQPLPAAEQVFPWLHGLHPENQLQLAFFTARKKSLRRIPKCIRGLTIVKAGGDLSHSRLKGAIAPDEILYPLKPGRDRKGSDEGAADFLDVDPKEGFSVRNFHIQTCKMATVSDLVVYRDYQTPQAEAERLARRLARAQAAWQRKTDGSAFCGGRMFNTFIVSDEYLKIEAVYPELVALDSDGCIANSAVDFFHAERVEMCSMTAASEISHNVWLGPTPDPSVDLSSSALPSSAQQEPPNFDIMVEASDIAQIPEPKAFKLLDDLLQRKANAELAENAIPQLEFPGSGAILPPTWSQAEVDGLLATCQWIYRQAHTPAKSSSSLSPTSQRRDSKLSLGSTSSSSSASDADADVDADVDADGDIPMHTSPSPTSPSSPAAAASKEGRRILLHCTDGYTESSLLALAYYIFAEHVPVHTAWVQLHRDLGRNFFAYATDVALLRAIQPRLLQASPKHCPGNLSMLCPPVPDWLEKMDGSLPSRILDHLYLGNLGHANNPGLLRELGIGQVLSVGEPVAWGCDGDGEDGGEGEEDGWKKEDWMFVDQTQDNGVDPLMGQFGGCLEFIEKGRRNGTSTLVHCRVGVSRSATICIAHVMRHLNLSFPRAYCFVRARRLNVIIQPHLRFVWELMKWEEDEVEVQGGQGEGEGEGQEEWGTVGRVRKRELDWATVCREIAAMNRPYSRQG
ncbi:tyrosine protein phosphatase 1 [Hortaea werneckii]|nr:tyrosine protein phosphatase 1 [Hortaea werneckii]KAI7302729.1 tyrosine protein phosphatase 1 [Hortaea werneckii]